MCKFAVAAAIGILISSGLLPNPAVCNLGRNEGRSLVAEFRDAHQLIAIHVVLAPSFPVEVGLQEDVLGLDALVSCSASPATDVHRAAVERSTSTTG